MGGAIGLGLRFEEKGKIREVYMDRWTNDCCWRMCDPEFINGGKELRAFVREAKFKNRWPESRRLKEIRPSEYGIILVDFPSRSIISRNNYSSPERLMMMKFSTSFNNEVQIARWLLNNNHIGKVTMFAIKDTPSVWEDVNLEQFATMLQNPDASFERLMVYVWLKDTFKYDHKNNRPTKEEIEAFCQEHGWKMPIVWEDEDEDEDEI